MYLLGHTYLKVGYQKRLVHWAVNGALVCEGSGAPPRIQGGCGGEVCLGGGGQRRARGRRAWAGTGLTDSSILAVLCAGAPCVISVRVDVRPGPAGTVFWRSVGEKSGPVLPR